VPKSLFCHGNQGKKENKKPEEGRDPGAAKEEKSVRIVREEKKRRG